VVDHDVFARELAGELTSLDDPEYPVIAEAQRVIAEMNTGYRDPAEVRVLFERLTGRAVDASFWLLPPFYTDFGRNIRIGRNVFVNHACEFMDRGGITIGDDVPIGPKMNLVTNHPLDPSRRRLTYCAPIVRSAAAHPSGNTPAKALCAPAKHQSVTHVPGINRYPSLRKGTEGCLRSAPFHFGHCGGFTPKSFSVIPPTPAKRSHRRAVSRDAGTQVSIARLWISEAAPCRARQHGLRRAGCRFTRALGGSQAGAAKSQHAEAGRAPATSSPRGTLRPRPTRLVASFPPHASSLDNRHSATIRRTECDRS
jgi:hypothetical protein